MKIFKYDIEDTLMSKLSIIPGGIIKNVPLTEGEFDEDDIHTTIVYVFTDFDSREYEVFSHVMDSGLIEKAMARYAPKVWKC